MFPVFHLASSTCRATKTFLAGWKVERGSTLSNKFWLCCSFFIKLTTCRATNLLGPTQINQSARRISSTCNKCFCCATSWSRKVKNGKHRRKLTTKQCCAQIEGFCISYFAAFIQTRFLTNRRAYFLVFYVSYSRTQAIRARFLSNSPLLGTQNHFPLIFPLVIYYRV